ncbi:hypothetical protein SESBI_09166 [Sesbania bispinosa]|nr:hypothetical protein SESBI_09166 [Sesbania bispinosa]
MVEQLAGETRWCAKDSDRSRAACTAVSHGGWRNDVLSLFCFDFAHFLLCEMLFSFDVQVIVRWWKSLMGYRKPLRLFV